MATALLQFPHTSFSICCNYWLNPVNTHVLILVYKPSCACYDYVISSSSFVHRTSMRCMQVRPSICLSVCPLQAGIMFRRQKLGSRGLCLGCSLRIGYLDMQLTSQKTLMRSRLHIQVFASEQPWLGRQLKGRKENCDFRPLHAVSPKRCNIRPRLLLISPFAFYLVWS